MSFILQNPVSTVIAINSGNLAISQSNASGFSVSQATGGNITFVSQNATSFYPGCFLFERKHPDLNLRFHVYKLKTEIRIFEQSNFTSPVAIIHDGGVSFSNLRFHDFNSEIVDGLSDSEKFCFIVLIRQLKGHNWEHSIFDEIRPHFCDPFWSDFLGEVKGLFTVSLVLDE